MPSSLSGELLVVSLDGLEIHGMKSLQYKHFCMMYSNNKYMCIDKDSFCLTGHRIKATMEDM
jgi:hypothetical protein